MQIKDLSMAICLPYPYPDHHILSNLSTILPHYIDYIKTSQNIGPRSYNKNSQNIEPRLYRAKIFLHPKR